MNVWESNGVWYYSFTWRGRFQEGTRSSEREAKQAMQEDHAIARHFWNDREEE